jgi:GntR family transcriptional regulator/MocR family aminotransferase
VPQLTATLPRAKRSAENRIKPRRNSSDGILPTIAIDRSAPVSLHQQVYNGYRAAILRGDLRPGQQVPSSRDFAADIQISRFPVLHAYAQLVAEGYFETRVGAGTFVAASLPEQLISVNQPLNQPMDPQPGPRSASRRSLAYPSFDRAVLTRGWGAFGVHQPAFDQFPFPVWSSLVMKHSRNPRMSALHHISPLGSERFREEICLYLRTARAVRCDPSQIMIVSGSQQALDITARVLLDADSPVFVEEPGYGLMRTVLAAAGCRLIPVPVDSEGMDIDFAIKTGKKAKAAFVTPSHQYPLGSTMSATRRLRLLNWAQSAGSWVVEDDYDSEYRYESAPIASLQGIDVNSRVIYIGTFSKVLFPSLRIGYLVIPPDLVERFSAVRLTMDIFPPYLFQEVLADFMSEGHFGRHIRKMRKLYGERREALVETLRSVCGDMFDVHGAEAGMHMTVTLPEGFHDVEISARAAQARLWLWPLSPSYLTDKPRHGFVLGFGSTPCDQMPAAVKAIRSMLFA